MEDTELILQANQRWGCDVIPSPEVNLTCSNYWRRHRGPRHRLTLEGYHRYSPLIEKLMSREGRTIYNQGNKRKRPYSDTFVDPEHGHLWDRKIPKFGTLCREGNGQATVASLQAELRESEENYRQRFWDIQKDPTPQNSKLHKKYNCSVLSLRRRQLHSRRNLYTKCYDNQGPLMPLLNVRNQHASQLKRFEDDFRREVTIREENKTKMKIYEETQVYGDIGEKSQKAWKGAPYVPYKIFSLAKAPCRQNNFRKSSAHVFLPADIAAAMIQEDLIYDSFYKY